MKVLFSKHNSICEIGVTRAFVNNGCDVIDIDDKIINVDEDDAYKEKIEEIIKKEKPDFVFSINFIPIISKICNSCINLKYLCWIVDCPYLGLYSNTINLKNNYIYVFDRIQYSEFAPRCTSSHIFYFPLGCDLDGFEKINISDEDVKYYESDVSFVGSLYSEKSPYNKIEQRLPKYVQGYIRAILESQSLICGSNIIPEIMNDSILQQLEQCIVLTQNSNYDIDIKTMLYNILLNPKCTEIERIKTLNSIAKYFSVDLYTNSDTSKLSGVACHGSVGTYGGMIKVFKSSKINLNITAKGIQSGGSLRVYDILACESMLITNYQRDLAEQFEDGKDLVFYYNIEDLIYKINYYLNHDEKRKEIARNGYLKVKNKYTYTLRILEMLRLANL